MKIYLRLLKYLLPYKFTVLVSVFCMVCFALTNGAMAFLIGPVMKFLFSKDSAEVQLIPFDLFTIPTEKMIMAVPAAILFVAAVKGISAFGQSYLMGYAGQRVVADLRANLYRHILDMPIDYFADTPTGVLSSRITNDVSMLEVMTTDTLVRALKQSFTIIVLAAVVIGMDWKLAISAFIAFPLVIYPMVRFGKKMKKASSKGQVTMGSMTTLLQEAITGIRIVKAFCMEGYEAARFKAENENFTKYKLRTIKVKAMSSPLMEFLGAFGFAVTILYAAYRINAGTLEAENFISFFAAVIMLYQPVKALNGVHLNLQNGLAAAERVFELVDAPSEVALRPSGTKKIDGVKEGIEFRDLGFSYGAKAILKDINLKVKSGEITAIVGMSGAGKTTLVNLLPRFFDATKGAIIIDGTDTRELDLKELRLSTAIVSQQIVLFNDTIKNNISYGDKTKSDEDVARAAKAANADKFIERLPDGYETLIGEGGVKLSGGERQRVSIARAILKNAAILVMDEATSALDTESELEVQKGLNNLMQGRTSFVIAHRLSTVRHADRIIVMSEGEIVETGRHEELLARGGAYARLHAMQFEDTEKKVGT